MPKSTIELARAVLERGVKLEQVEKMASYLWNITDAFQFRNIQDFDENTSHIIGREWQEINYTGDEGMSWQSQKKKYAPYGITNFKSLDNLERFFPIESQLPYFDRIYQPRYPNALLHSLILK